MRVDPRLAATARTFARYAPVFDQAVALNAKSLIGLMSAGVCPGRTADVLAQRPTVRRAYRLCAPFRYATSATLLCAVDGDDDRQRTRRRRRAIAAERRCHVGHWGFGVSRHLYLAIGPAYGARAVADAIGGDADDCGSVDLSRLLLCALAHQGIHHVSRGRACRRQVGSG